MERIMDRASLKEISKHYGIFLEFKEIHPNSKDEFLMAHSDEDLTRWEWHIKQAERKPDFVEMEYKEDVTARQLADSRRFEAWEQMPPYMRVNYLRIADCFPGVQIAAVGSRINGDYVEKWSNEHIRQMRRDLLKPDKEESDYDYLVMNIEYIIKLNGRAIDNDIVRKESGVNCDYLKTVNLNFDRILIPMWDFSKLPDDKKQEARELFAAQKWGALMKMHNDYNLSENNYCCDEQPIIRWFRWAIQNDKI